MDVGGVILLLDVNVHTRVNDGLIGMGNGDGKVLCHVCHLVINVICTCNVTMR